MKTTAHRVVRQCGRVFTKEGMKGSPIHQNLSTSFVDLTLLVRFLRDRRFTGTVRVEWEGYDGEIFFTRSPRIHAREYDRSVGRIAQGQNAFRRILQRSRRPSGKIRVVKSDPRTAEVLRKPFVDDRIVAQARGTVFGKSDQIATLSKRVATSALPVRTDNTRAALLATDLLLSFKEAFEKSKIKFDSAFEIACELKQMNILFSTPTAAISASIRTRSSSAALSILLISSKASSPLCVIFLTA